MELDNLIRNCAFVGSLITTLATMFNIIGVYNRMIQSQYELAWITFGYLLTSLVILSPLIYFGWRIDKPKKNS